MPRAFLEFSQLKDSVAIIPVDEIIWNVFFLFLPETKKVHFPFVFIFFLFPLFSLCYPVYLRDMLSVRNSSYNLRGNYILCLSKVKTTTYGLHSFFILSYLFFDILLYITVKHNIIVQMITE